MRKLVVIAVLVSLQGYLPSTHADEGDPVRLRNQAFASAKYADQIYHVFEAILHADPSTAAELFYRSAYPDYAFQSGETVPRLRALQLLAKDGSVPADVRNVVLSSIDVTPSGLVLTNPFEDPGAMYLQTNRRPLEHNVRDFDTMAEGNRAARAIIEKIFRWRGVAEGVGIVDALDDMNIRGTQLVFAYEYAERKMDRFWNLVRRHGRALVNHVNARVVLEKANVVEQAVTYGAKLMHHMGSLSDVAAWKSGPITVEPRGDGAAFGRIDDPGIKRAIRHGDVASNRDRRIARAALDGEPTTVRQRAALRAKEVARAVRDAIFGSKK